MKGVIVDTSVWVRALAGKQPYRDTLANLIVKERVLGHDLIYGELMIGDAGARAVLLSKYAKYAYAATVPHEQVVELVRARRLFGKKLSWIDVHLLASARVHGAQLYTADGSLDMHAKALRVQYV